MGTFEISKMKTILEKEYTDETLMDIEDDVCDAIGYNNLPTDKNGFTSGTFILTLTWKEDDDL